MKIGIDISQVVYKTGVSHYLTNIVKNLLLIDKENEYVLFAGTLRRRKDVINTIEGFKGNFTKKIYLFPPTASNLFWNSLHLLPVERLIGKIDVFHSSDWAQPPTKAYKVTTVHDLAPLKFPKNTHPKIVKVHKRRLKWIAKEVDKIIVPSKTTKADLVDLRIEEKRIHVIPEAPVYSPVKKQKVQKIKKDYKINGDYVLSVGIRPRKNTENIIKAFDLARAGKNLKLVLVGTPANIKLEETRGIRITGSVSDEEMAALYTGASALVYPSLYEGFGLPILDSFNCKIPVVTSNISSMPEVAGDAAILVDPYSVDSIKEGILKALSQKKTWVKKGKERVKAFSWKKTAQETLKVYKQDI